MGQYPNVAKGVKKLYAGELLCLIGSIVMGLSTILAVGAAAGGSIGGALAGGAMMIVSGILLIVGAIIAFVGVCKGAKESKKFKLALIFILASIVVSGTTSVGLSEGAKIVVTSVGSAINLVQMYLVVSGVCELLPGSPLVEKGDKVCILACVAVVLSSVAQVLSSLSILAVVLAVVSLLFSVVYYILYLSFLAKARKAL